MNMNIKSTMRPKQKSFDIVFLKEAKNSVLSNSYWNDIIRLFHFFRRTFFCCFSNFIIILLIFIAPKYAFSQSNLGKNFKVIVPLLYGVLCTDTSPSMLIFYSPSNTIVTLQYAGDTTTIQIPVNMFASFVVLPFHQKFNDSQGDITELYISSPDSMAVFLFNPFWPIDILNVLPSDKWGNYYIIPSSFHYLIETWNSDSFLNENIIPLFNQTEIHDTSIF